MGEHRSASHEETRRASVLGSLLSCSAARAVAMSLLDIPGSRGADGYCSLPHDVEQDFRHAVWTWGELV